MFGRRVVLAVGALMLASGLAACGEEAVTGGDVTLPVPEPVATVPADPITTEAPVQAGPGAAPATTDEAPAPAGGGEAGDPPYSGDPAQDVLLDACADGDMKSCDDAFYGSDPGSPQETYAGTCGGRMDDDLYAGFCELSGN